MDYAFLVVNKCDKTSARKPKGAKISDYKGPNVCWIEGRKSFHSLDPYLCSHDG